MGQAIEMGPFTFKVEKATAFTDDQTYDDARRVVQVIFKLLEQESNSKADFGYFLSDRGDGQGRPSFTMFTHPHVTIEDDHGHSFNTDVRNDKHVRRDTGSWYADFYLYLWSNWVSDAVEEKEQAFGRAHLEMQPGDFRLTITNPDPEEGQPRAVSIQLQ